MKLSPEKMKAISDLIEESDAIVMVGWRGDREEETEHVGIVASDNMGTIGHLGILSAGTQLLYLANFTYFDKEEVE